MPPLVIVLVGVIGIGSLLIRSLGVLLAAKVGGIHVTDFNILDGLEIGVAERWGIRWHLNLGVFSGGVRMLGSRSDEGEGSFVRATPRQQALVYVAGGLSNTILGVVFLLGSLYSPFAPLLFLAAFNLTFGLMSLLPIPPLNGGMALRCLLKGRASKA